MASATSSPAAGTWMPIPVMAKAVVMFLGLATPTLAGRASAAPSPEGITEPATPPRVVSRFNLAVNLGWSYLTVPAGVSPDYQSLRLRIAGSVPSFWDDRASLRVLLLEKTGIDERSGGAAGTRFLTRHEVRTLALDLLPRGRFGGTLGRHRPVTSALGLNDIDGVTLRWGHPQRGAQATVFGGFNVEYWEAEFEPEEPVVGGAIRVGSHGRGPAAEVSAIRERFEKGKGRTRVGADGGWLAGTLTLDGRAEADLTAGILSFARISATTKLGPRFGPYVQGGYRRGLLFTDSPNAVGAASDTLGYRRALRDASIGATWRASDDWTFDGRLTSESGLRNAVGGDLLLRVESLPRGFDGRVGLGMSKSIWARSVRGSLGLEHAWGAGRLSFDGTVLAYRWRRPDLSSSTRWRLAPGLRFSRPFGRGCSLLITGREILDDRLNTRTEAGVWISYRVAT
jgi:hypothetical protein